MSPVRPRRKMSRGSHRRGVEIALTIAAVFRATRNRPGTLRAHPLLDFGSRRSRVYVLPLRRLRDNPPHVAARVDQSGFALVPRPEHLLRGRAAEDAGVDEAGEFDARDVARRALDAFKVPDGFGPAGGSQRQQNAPMRERQGIAIGTHGLG